MAENSNPWANRRPPETDANNEPQVQADQELHLDDIEETLDEDIDALEEAESISPNDKDFTKEATELQKKLKEMQDHLLRAKAETENVRRRSTEDVRRARESATASLVQQLLPVYDSLEQALQSNQNTDELTKGVELTLKLLTETLTRSGLKILDPTGEKFNPEHHEAMCTQPSEEHEPGIVINVLQKGFLLRERIVRPARVIVSAEG